MRSSPVASLRAALGLALLVLAGCGGSEKSVVGTWRLDLDQALDGAVQSIQASIQRLPGATGGDGQIREAAKRSLEGMAVEFVLAADHTFHGRMSANGSTRDGVRGRWEERGSVVVLTPTDIGGRPPTGAASIELTKKDGRLEMQNGPLRFVLKRS